MGELGVPDTQTSLVPIPIDFPKPESMEMEMGTEMGMGMGMGMVDHVSIIQVSIGGKHVVSLSSTGTIYSWGDNNKGQLGSGEMGMGTSVPGAIKLPRRQKATQISAGQFHTLAIVGKTWQTAIVDDEGMAMAMASMVMLMMMECRSGE